MPKKIYFGNFPNSYSYDSSLPIGWNKWDAQEDWNGFEEDFPEEDVEEIEEPPLIKNAEDE